MMVIPQRKAKKQQEEMNKKLGVGVTIMTIGGIIGEIVQMDNEHIWLATGLGEDKIVMQFSQRAIHSIVNAPSTPAEPTGEPTDEVVDEIKLLNQIAKKSKGNFGLFLLQFLTYVCGFWHRIYHLGDMYV